MILYPWLKERRYTGWLLFIKKARKQLGLLMDEDNKPAGGKWSYDEDNRKKIPKNTSIPYSSSAGGVTAP